MGDDRRPNFEEQPEELDPTASRESMSSSDLQLEAKRLAKRRGVDGHRPPSDAGRTDPEDPKD